MYFVAFKTENVYNVLIHYLKERGRSSDTQGVVASNMMPLCVI